MKAFTVIELDEWALLFDGRKLVVEDHSIELDQLEHQAKGECFTLEVISGYDTDLDDHVTENGRANDIDLAKAKEMLK